MGKQQDHVEVLREMREVALFIEGEATPQTDALAAAISALTVDEAAVERAAMELYERNEGHLRHADWGTTPNQAQYRSDARAALQAAIHGDAK